MPDNGRKTCSKCGRTLKETEFFKMKTGQRCDLCKDCLTQYIDNRNPETFLWILEMFDVPYFEKKWIQIANDRYLKDPAKFGPKSVIGTYLRTMNMVQYADYTFSDSDHLKKPDPEPVVEEDPDYEEKLLAQLEAGEISQGQYDTLTHTNAKNMPYSENVEFVDMSAAEPSTPQEQAPQYQISATYWTDQLTEEDIKYLMLKWGTVYTPEQWIKMETMYSKYAQEYELNTDREEVLKQICKTSLKMNECLDVGDLTGYKNLATVFDQLRKGGKFTEAQNKEDRQQVLSSIGELVQLCEQEGGIIPNLPQFDPDQYPQDKIDFTIKDLKAYNYALVSEELGLGDLIESYIEKLEKAENAEIDLNAGLVTSAEEADKDNLTEEEFEEWGNFIDNEVEAEAEMLEKFLAGDL